MANFLTEKLGPLPVWVYGAGAGGIVLVLLSMSKKKASAAAATTATNAAGGTGTIPGTNTAVAPGAQSVFPAANFGTSTTGGGSSLFGGQTNVDASTGTPAVVSNPAPTNTTTTSTTTPVQNSSIPGVPSGIEWVKPNESIAGGGKAPSTGQWILYLNDAQTGGNGALPISMNTWVPIPGAATDQTQQPTADQINQAYQNAINTMVAQGYASTLQALAKP